ncbi:hypothetical protein AZE42_09544, partial [Rhizopogon vesiculosus]
SATRTFSL